MSKTLSVDLRLRVMKAVPASRISPPSPGSTASSTPIPSASSASTRPGPGRASPAPTEPRVRTLIEAASHRLRVLPPCSPDFNLVENAFAKLTAPRARPPSAPSKAPGPPSPASPTPFAPANRFGACGYDPDEQDDALDARRDPFPAAKLDNVHVDAQPFQRDPDLLISRIPLERRASDLLGRVDEVDSQID